MTEICLFPGCSRELYSDNSSGVCRDHNHSTACLCMRCRGLTPERRRPRKTATVTKRTPVPALPVEEAGHPDRVVVQVPVATTCSSINVRAKVSLPRAPWERTLP